MVTAVQAPPVAAVITEPAAIPGCDYMGRLIALKSLGLRSPETVDFWSKILHKEPDAWLRRQAPINAFGHFGRQFAPDALNLLATEPSQYMQWQLMQGNFETRQGQRVPQLLGHLDPGYAAIAGRGSPLATRHSGRPPQPLVV